MKNTHVKPLRNPHDILKELHRSDTALQLGAYGTALAKYNIMTHNGERYGGKEAAEYAIIGRLPKFITASVLPEQKDTLSRKEKVELLANDIIPYNHALRELVDTAPTLTFPDVLEFIGGASLSHDPRVSPFAIQHSRVVLNGMRHEIASENVFWAIDGVTDVQQATVDEELVGKDLIVTYHDKKIPFDIKASELGAHKKNEHLRYVTDSIGLYSGFLDEDFGNGFRASQSATDRQVERYTRALDEGVTRLAKAS